MDHSPALPATPPEPEKTGVEPKQEPASGEVTILPAEDNKAYASMATTLETFVGSGIRPPAVPFLLTWERNAEERFQNVDAERKQALRDLKDMTEKCHQQELLVAKYSGGYLGSLGQNIMITMGALMLGAGISELNRQIASLAIVLMILGPVLLFAGWVLAIADALKKR